VATGVETELGQCVSALREAEVPAKRYVPWVATAFVLCYMLRSPATAGRTVETAAGGLASAAGALATFVDELAS
jgi:hypothetical protein